MGNVPMNELASIVQLGFAAAMAILIWRAYEQGQAKILSVIEKNSEAMQKVSLVVEQLTRTAESLVNGIGELDKRMMRLESCTHSEADGHGACPYVAAARKEG